jgi:type II secretory pathway predicted ATPase ExeA
MSEPDIPITRIGESVEAASVEENVDDARTGEQRFLEYYGLNEQPFGVTPDPRFLYLGTQHRQALAALNYGTESNRGFLTLIAQPGMGKTSLIFQYLEGLREKARTVFIFQTGGNSRDLMRYLLADLGLDGAGKDLPEMHSILNQVLLEEMRAGRRFVLVIDEAQNLTERVLESVRLLSNFETPWAKLMQIVLAGQPQLTEQLAKPSMAQLRQRVSLSIRIEPLTSEEVNAYVDHRLWVAGYKGSSLFSVGAQKLLAEVSEGIPRNINNICFCAMSLGWATKQKTIDREMMRDVLADLNLGSPNGKTDLVPKSADEPKHSVLQILHPPVLTLKEPPARGWLAKITISSVVLLALGWSGVQFNLGQRLAFSLHGIGAAVKSLVLRTPATISLDQLAPAGLDMVSPGQRSEASTDNKNPGVPQHVRYSQQSQAGNPSEASR